MGRRLRIALLATSFTLFAGGAGIVGYGTYKDMQGADSRNQRIERLVERFKACPERFRSISECHTPTESRNILIEAERLSSDNCAEAGVKFAEINMPNDAREMAAKCASEGNEDGRRRILEELSVREEAVGKTRRELGR